MRRHGGERPASAGWYRVVPSRLTPAVRRSVRPEVSGPDTKKEQVPGAARCRPFRLQAVEGLDPVEALVLRPEGQGVGENALLRGADAAQDKPAGDAGGGEADRAAGQVLRGQDPAINGTPRAVAVHPHAEERSAQA